MPMTVTRWYWSLFDWCNWSAKFFGLCASFYYEMEMPLLLVIWHTILSSPLIGHSSDCLQFLSAPQ